MNFPDVIQRWNIDEPEALVARAGESLPFGLSLVLVVAIFVREPGIQEINMRWLKIPFDHLSPVHTDGEILPEQLTDFEYRIEPGRLQIYIP